MKTKHGVWRYSFWRCGYLFCFLGRQAVAVCTVMSASVEGRNRCTTTCIRTYFLYVRATGLVTSCPYASAPHSRLLSSNF